MVAIIHTPNNLRTALNYNEQKIKEKKAVCIAAANYPKDLKDLNFHTKLNRLQNLAALNQNVKRNTVHISLNFDPSEKLSPAVLENIASAYIEKIGFAGQPYLVYQHLDAGHPHIHILTTNIRCNGKRIELHNIGRNQSEKARKEIENEFNLVKAGSEKISENLKSAPVQKIQYGKSETKRSVSNVLTKVINSYKFTSLPELNAVLQLFNVVAERGTENSRTYQKNGLLYHLLDEKGNKIGVPIKASLFYNKPTLSFLEKKFLQNESQREGYKKNIKNRIDWLLLKSSHHSLQEIINLLDKEKIQAVIRQNTSGLVYGITYVDHKTGCVFNGSDLGKPYSAKGLQERCTTSASTGISRQPSEPKDQKQAALSKQNEISTISENTAVLSSIIEPQQNTTYIPGAIKKRKKKIKRKQLF